MPAYSGTPLARKLGIKEGCSVLLVRAPKAFERELEGLPASATVTRTRRKSALHDVIVCFVESLGQLAESLDMLPPHMTPACGLWIAWRKGRRGEGSFGENSVREVGLRHGLVDNKVCAIDETWSGLRFVIRVKDR
jgi:hypothetical protein